MVLGFKVEKLSKLKSISQRQYFKMKETKNMTIFAYTVREDTHKKSVYFSGRTTKGVGRGNTLDH